MVILQTLSCSSSIHLYNLKNPSLLNSSVSICSFRSPVIKIENKRLCSKLGVKCSIGYESNGYGAYEDQQFPRPSEIQWKKELCNFVQIIGTVGSPVQIKKLSSGKALAWSRLAFKKSSTETSWINLTFWDELAQTAFQHVEKGDQIFVSGRLISDIVENDDGKQQTFFKIVVQQLNFVERSQPSNTLVNGDSNQAVSLGKPINSQNGNVSGSTEALWQAFFANPLEWWDNRKNKVLISTNDVIG
ncbi:protein OSB2, chloroplastic-like [Impatiens glandulifera]|uniref:protein OSB2, chloroplastic-like n=1 Tax=Impatiens glandulifera TaxID=253017 RepID=UPI001FB0D15D|nr:protein OSB2, chloroplastic-like [Impatiens glandulifera]